MPYLDSIESLEPELVLQTNTRPVIVHCSDLNYYYCKHHNGFGTARRPIQEYIATRFLQIWELNVPDYAFVRVEREHIPLNLGLPFKNFEVPLFGLKKIPDAADLNDLVAALAPNQKQRVSSKGDLLKLAFFDIWTSNEDRKFNNYNLLLQAFNDQYRFIPIDHEMCFNSGNLHRELYTINYNETLIDTPLFGKLFTPKELNKEGLLDGLRDSYYLCTTICRNNLDQILKEVPPEWLMDYEQYRIILLQNLLSDNWFDNCWQEFISPCSKI